MPKYKLTYFDIRGLAESARMLFVIAGQEFEDVRLQQKEWPAIKPTTPFGRLPLLEVDGKVLPESRAINYYLAKEFNLYGASNWEGAAIDVVGELVFDMMKPFGEFMFEKDEARKAELKKKYDEALPVGLERLEGSLAKNNGGDGFFVGDKISLADISVFNAFEYCVKGDNATILDKYPKLKAWQARVASDEKIAAYLAQRKSTEKAAPGFGKPSDNTMPSYKLTYFDIKGRAEPVRMLFTVAGVPFEDVRIKQADWSAMKSKTPFGQLPFLEVDGKVLAQTRAITYYVARDLKLYGANNWESAQIDVVGELMFDLVRPYTEKIMFEKDEQKKAENLKKYLSETAPTILANVEEQLKKNKGGDGFFVGDKISLADINVFSSFDFTSLPEKLDNMAKYPKLKALLDRVKANKNMAAYLAKRKPSPY
ncbi:uncharacterized protein LOC110974076 [Acanthaster planci]|uniref:Uncharacterized protein LOC110974076 n=1 Tax=Acanthaster planci TaxID=133434 RepID=A0A8B7XMB5_ACAPL|nr:uncharacterized protein LOC110974076 [Acanthaster planci]